MKVLYVTMLALALVACGKDKKSDADSSNNPDGGQANGDGGKGGASGGIGEQPPGNLVKLSDVAVGSCGATPADSDFVNSFEVVDCTELHYMEVAGSYELSGGKDDYPGNAALIGASYEGCEPVFQTYTGTPFWDSAYDIRTITPSPFTWAEGDRTVICLVANVDGSVLTKSTAKP